MTQTFDSIYAALQNEPRLLIEAELKPVQGSRFQPTGFPDLGAATYKCPDGTPMLLVESAQSMANRLEMVCWNEAKDEIIDELKGLPHVVVKMNDGRQTSSVQEAHRLASYYLIEITDLKNKILGELGNGNNQALDIRKLARAILKLDVGSILHGVFIAKKDVYEGRARLQRILSSFIEAEDYEVAASGGAKLDRFEAKGSVDESGTKGSSEGRGNIIYPRIEYTAKKITAYFNLDLATLRGYGFEESQNKLIVALALFKILRLLNSHLRLRTACDFDVKQIAVTRPAGISLDNSPELLQELTANIRRLIDECKFDSQPTVLAETASTKKKKKQEAAENPTEEEENL
jgi:CRISPR-associated protein Csb1